MKFRSHLSFPHLSAENVLLLNAATQTQPAAQIAWDQWQARFHIESADSQSLSLLSMVYSNLKSSLAEPQSTRLKGVYKRTWYANRLLLAEMAPVLDCLGDHGIRAMVLNDAALLAAYYPDIAYRTIHCVDLLIPADKYQDGRARVAECGWQWQAGPSFGSPSELSISCYSQTGDRHLRMWCNLFVAEPQQDTEERSWSDARQFELDGHPVMCLGPVEQLLILSSEVFRSPEPAISTYADAMLLVRLLSPPDWAQLVGKAQRYEHILPLRSMLALLEKHLAVELPSWVLTALHKMAISHKELIYYHTGCDTRALRFKSTCLRVLSHLQRGATHG